MRNSASLILAMVAAFALVGCAAKTPTPHGDQTTENSWETTISRHGALLSPHLGKSIRVDDADGVEITLVDFAQLPGWGEDDHGAALTAFRKSCELNGEGRKLSFRQGLMLERRDWDQVCSELTAWRGSERAFLESRFVPVKIAPSQDALFTGYYEPEIQASRTKTGPFQYPLHRTPDDLVVRDGRYGRINAQGQFIPYLSRAEIARGGLQSNKLAIAYLADPVDKFFLQIQGSGRLRFADGSVMRVGFAAKNGHPYRSVGREMIRRGWTSKNKASAQAIKSFVRRDPRRGRQLLNSNPSYVFFREIKDLKPDDGPLGALEVPLSAGRSIAVDKRFTPLGAPVWIEVERPKAPIKRLMVAQDVGGAIKGAQRADIYFGSGHEAGAEAGTTKFSGSMTVLYPVDTILRMLGAAS
ncbi:MAG: MltA domain-containing protein [Neomegalonema sp.]|nr:MltA domain-containing protein [Neomegalonema sp.]